MSWMALGGTKAIIPPEILGIVSLTQVLGVPRKAIQKIQLSANMLSTAKVLCQELFGPQNNESWGTFDPSQGVRALVDTMTEFINTNGDAQTWFQLCTMNHPSPVHVIGAQLDSSVTTVTNLYVPPAHNMDVFAIASPMLLDPTNYMGPVGNVAGTQDNELRADNLWPWCIDPGFGNGEAGKAIALQYAKTQGYPVCPTGLSTWVTADAQRWAVRGAINAGLSVFLFVHELEAKSAPDPDYNQCELLSGSTMMASTGTCGP
jgi:hypothetical protein